MRVRWNQRFPLRQSDQWYIDVVNMNFLNKIVSRLHTRQQLIHFIYIFVQLEENINWYIVSIFVGTLHFCFFSDSYRNL